MARDPVILRIDPGEIGGWPILRIEYPTDPARLAALLPPGIEPADTSNVHLSIYNVPVSEEPEYGVVVKIDALYRGVKGGYAVAYGIDQESAVYISKETNGQPKFLAEIEYFRDGDAVRARCSHHGYTFLEFRGTTTGEAPLPGRFADRDYWIKVSRAVGFAEKAYDFPPHVVLVQAEYQPIHRADVSGELRLLESPWDPIAEWLPIRGPVRAQLTLDQPLSRSITLEGPLDPEAFWPHVDTIGSSRWPGTRGGPKRSA
ncbi:acetoacetate decarboxylase family protein [Myxococcota bacterium]|nr:acetoacetate decarboxylase family protein [Myxococcota bacterium]